MNKLSSVFYMLFGLGFAVLAVLMMFVPMASLSNGYIVSGAQMFWGKGVNGGAWPAFVGYMLILVGGLTMGVMALPFIQPSTKTEKIVLISAGAAIFIGAVLVGLIFVEYSANNGYYKNLDYFHAGYYLTLAFSAIALASDVVALVLDW